MNPRDDRFGPQVPVVARVGTTPQGRAWLAQLPALVAGLEREWGVSVGHPYLAGSAAWTAPATTADGTPAVLKVSWPHREARGEATALRFWDGDGAVGVLRSDDQRYALLLERCQPGVDLSQAGASAEKRLTIAAGVLRRLWSRRPTAELALERLSDVAAQWAELVVERHDRLGQPLDCELVARGAELLRTLPSTATRDVVVHGDFNPGNVLLGRRAWLAIDPKPILGDPAYDPWPLLIQLDAPFEQPDPVRFLAMRYGRFGDLVGEPPQRLVQWSIARTVESALWQLDEGDVAAARQQMNEAAVLANIADL
jgi:streptomycin 6-kinase